MGRITIFASDCCSDSSLLRSAFHKWSIPYKEISLTTHPRRRNDMIQLSNCRTTPQVFFNEQHIGGAHETIALLEQYETQDKTGEGPLKRLQTEVLEKSSPTDSRFRRSKRSSSIDRALNNTTINGNSTLDVVEENQEGETMTVNTNATAANILHGGGDFHTNKISPTSIPIEDDRIDIHPVGSVTVLTITRELLRCLPRFNHVHNGITYKHCFSGKEAMQALLKDSTSSTNSIHYSKFTTQEEILEYARLLQQYKFIHDVTTDESSYQPFSPKRYYRLQPLHTPQIMNTFRLYTKDTGLDQKFPDPNPLATLSNLIRQMTDAILASYKSNHNQSSSSSPGLLKSSLTNRKSLRLSLSPRLSLTPKFQSKSQNGNFLKLPSSPSSPSSSSSFSSSSSHNNNNNNNSTYNYDAIRHTKEFQSFEESICQLQLMDLSYMEVRSKVAFFLNLYNLMVRHALIRFHPKSVTPAFFRSIQYRLGNNYLLSLDDIHHGILRNNSDHPLTGERCFAPDDPRNVLRLPGRDTRIHFCLNSGKGNCDEVHEFHGEAIDEELRVQAENYCNKDKNIRLEENTNTLILPRFMKKYVVDFATDGLLEQIPRRIIRYLRNEKRERLHKMMKAAKEHPEESPLHIVFDGEGRENGFRGGGGGGGSSSSTRELASDVLSQSQSQSSSLGSTSRKKVRTSKTKIMCSTLRTYSFSSSSSSSHYMRVPSSSSNSSYHHLHHPHYRPTTCLKDHKYYTRSSYSSSFLKRRQRRRNFLLKLKSFLMAKGRAEGDGEDGVVGIDGSGRTFIFNGRSTTSSSKQNHILRRRGRRTRRDKWQVFSNSEEEEVGRGTDCSTSGRVGSLVSNQHSPRQGGYTDKHTTNGPRYELSHHGNLHSSSEGRNHDKDDEDEAGGGQEKEQNARHAFSAPVHTIEFNSIPEQDSDTDSETDPAKDKSHLLSDTPSPNIMQKEKESITNVFSTENKNTNSNIAKSNTFETSQLTPSTCKDSDGSKSYSSSHDEEEEELCEDLKIPIVSYDENENVIDVGNIVQHVGNDNDNHNLRDNVQTMEETNSSNSCSKNNDENNLSLESKTDIISIVSDNEDEEAHHIFEMNDFTDLSFGSQEEEEKVLQAKHNLDLDLSYDSTISCNNLGPVSPSIQSLRSPIKT